MSRSDELSRLHLFSRGVAATTLLLVVAGGLVTSTGSGLAVPDWPLSYGQWFPPMVGGVRFEHSHRLIAVTVALLTIVLAVWLWRAARTQTIRWLGLVAVGMVLAQALLGGATVLLKLPPIVSIGHACLAQLFFCSVVTIAVMTSQSWHCATPTSAEDATRLRYLAAMTTGFIFVQLVLGAVVRHTEGRGITPHVVVALLVTMHVMLLARRISLRHRAQAWLARPAMVLGALLVVQLMLGVGALIVVLGSSATPPPHSVTVLVRTAHVTVGALLLATSWIITLSSYRLCAPAAMAPTVSIAVGVAS